MPPTRRSSSAITPTRKTRLAASNQDVTGKQSSKSVTPSPKSVTPRSQSRRTKSNATSDDNQTTLQAPDKDEDSHQNEDSGSPGPDSEGTSRRSSRQRTVSKRLQDMELSFGKKKVQNKREREDIQPECTPSKKTRLDRGEKRPPAAAADLPQAPTSRLRKGAEKTSIKEPRTPPPSHTKDTNTSKLNIQASQNAKGAKHKEAKEDADSPELTEPEQPVEAEPEQPFQAEPEPEPEQPVQAEPDPEQPVQAEPEPEQSVQAEPVQAEPEQPVQAEPEQPVQAEPVQAEPEQPVQAEPVQAEPEPEQPVQAEPVQAEPEPEQPVQAEPVQAEPEPEQPVQADTTPSDTATEGGQVGVTIEVTLESGVETSKDMDLCQESTEVPEHIQGDSLVESEATVTLCLPEGQPKALSSSETQEKQEAGETSKPVIETCSDPVQHSSCEDDSVPDTDQEAVLGNEKYVSSIEKDCSETVETKSDSVTLLDESTDSTSHKEQEEYGGPEPTTTPPEDTEIKPEGDLSSIKKDSELVSETPEDKDNKVDGESEAEGEESGSTVAVEGQQPADNTQQFVMLDDGRQLLLSNSDALDTGAEAVMEELSLMKEVQFLLNNHNAGSAPTGPNGKKIKFVTVNTQVLQGTMDNSKVHLPVAITTSDVCLKTDVRMKSELRKKSNPHDARLDMRIIVDGQVGTGPPTVLSADGFYRCTMCAYKTDKKANWYKHRYTHMAHRRYQCIDCDHQATTSSNLKRHMLIHSDVKVFGCDLCNAEFRQKIHLVRHVKYKHQKKEVKCGHCDYVCASFSPDLLAHIKRRHQSEADSSHRCVECGFTAANSRDLKQHLKFHKAGPELKLYCELCSFVTDCASRLQRHHLVHNKLRPYWCSLCSYKASQKEHVMRHLRTKHKMTISSVYETVDDLEGVPVTTIVPGDIPPGETHSGQTMILLESAEEDSSMPQDEEEEDATQCTVPKSDPETEATTSSSQNADPETSTEGGKPPVLVEIKEQEGSALESEHQLQEAEEASGEDPSEATYTVQSVPANTKEEDEAEPTDGVSSARARLAEACSTRLDSRLIYAPTQKTVKKKHYPPADFSSREKVFSCIHCTMKFSKLINLYKHMTVQHKDVQTSKADGMHTCVWCEYQTNKWKNLLVHMRKHNYREEYGTVTTRYACVVCTYSSQHRKALYAHMIKKHKVQIYIKPDGSASCVIDDTIPGTMSATDGSAVVLQRPRVGATAPKMEDHRGVVVMTQHGQEPEGTPMVTTPGVGVAEAHNTQTVMIELEPGMPATAVEILAPHHAGSGQEDVDHEAADAIEGLQALAEQVMAAQHQQDLEEGEVRLERSAEQKPALKAEEQEQEEEQEEGEVVDQDDQTQIHIQDCSGQVMEGQNIQLTPEQLMQLTSGDFIEINGEMYKVEVAEETADAAEESYT